MRRIFWYLAPNTTFTTGTSLLDMFVGFYLFRFGTSSYLAPLAFSMAGWIMVPFAQAVCAGLSRYISLPNSLRFGALATGATFAAIAVLATIGAAWWMIVPVGISYGIVRSLYWQARTQVDFRLAPEVGADRYFGYQAAASSAAATLVGITSGVIVERFPSQGYIFVFALGSSLLVATTFLVRELPNVHGAFSWTSLRWLSRENPAFGRVFVASIFRGMSYYGLLPVAIQLFTFSALQRELPVAGLSGLGAILALFVGGAVSRSLRPEHRERASWVSSITLLALGGALALFPTGLLGSVYLVAAPLAVVALVAATSSVDNAIFGYGDGLVGECGVARELGLMIGRVMAALPLMLIAAGPEIVGLYLAFLSLMHPVQVLVLFRTYRGAPMVERVE